MKDLERTLYETDFSKYTDLKSRLAKKLFSQKDNDKIVQLPFARLSDDDVAYVYAAQGVHGDEFMQKKPEKE